MNGVDGDGGGGGRGAALAPPSPLEWKFSQVFGERAAGEEVQEGKIVSSDINVAPSFSVQSYLNIRVLISIP